MSAIRITGLIPCKNERKNLRACIESFRDLTDEMLVADSGSTDGTIEIARSLGCRVVEREYVFSGDFKNWAIPQATHEWVLLLDADERVTPALAEEIRRIKEQGPDADGYWIGRENYFMGRRVRFSGWRNDACIRLFHRDRGRYVGPSDHGEIVISTGRVGRLKQKMLHYTLWSYDQYVKKLDRYARVQAEQWRDAGKRPSAFKLLTNGPLRALRCYVLQLGFLDGMVGMQLAALAGYYSFLKQARLWELCEALPQPDCEAEFEARLTETSQRTAA
jgi:glycosyltransferase involved in cell wall biosynthesis